MSCVAGDETGATPPIQLVARLHEPACGLSQVCPCAVAQVRPAHVADRTIARARRGVKRLLMFLPLARKMYDGFARHVTAPPAAIAQGFRSGAARFGRCRP